MDSERNLQQRGRRRNYKQAGQQTLSSRDNQGGERVVSQQWAIRTE